MQLIRHILLLCLCLAPALVRSADLPTTATTIRITVPDVGDFILKDLTNLGSESEVVEHKIIGPGDVEVVRKVPGRLKWLDISFKRPLSKSKELSDWRKLVEAGNIANARKNIQITAYTDELIPVATWDIVNAWPSAIIYDQKPDGTYVETLRLVHEGLTRVSP